MPHISPGGQDSAVSDVRRRGPTAFVHFRIDPSRGTHAFSARTFDAPVAAATHPGPHRERPRLLVHPAGVSRPGSERLREPGKTYAGERSAGAGRGRNQATAWSFAPVAPWGGRE
jgi:hypothetical protein